jgi:hypothetical protein
MSKTTRDKLSNINRCKYRGGIPVDQFDKKGSYIRSFNSAKEAERFYNIPFMHIAIRRVCNGITKTAYGFIWKDKSK